MSPEQLAGALDINLQTDIYSLGLVLYKLLSGRDAFRGLSREEYEPLDKIDKSIAKEVVGIVDRALSYNREDRFASAFEMKLDIEKSLAPYRHQDRKQLITEGLSGPVAPPVSSTKGPSVLKWLIGIAGAVVIVFLLYVGLSSWFHWISKGKAEKAVFNLRDKITDTQGRYKSLNLAVVGFLMSEAEDSLNSKNFKRARSLCDSGSGMIDTEVESYRDSTSNRYNEVAALLDRCENATAKDEIDKEYVTVAKDRYNEKDYDSANALLASATKKIKNECRKASPARVLIAQGTLRIGCYVGGNPVTAGCDIHVDGKLKGPAHRDYQLDEGQHIIRAIFGELQKDTVITITRGKTKKVRLELTNQ